MQVVPHRNVVSPVGTGQADRRQRRAGSAQRWLNAALACTFFVAREVSALPRARRAVRRAGGGAASSGTATMNSHPGPLFRTPISPARPGCSGTPSTHWCSSSSSGRPPTGDRPDSLFVVMVLRRRRPLAAHALPCVDNVKTLYDPEGFHILRPADARAVTWRRPGRSRLLAGLRPGPQASSCSRVTRP
jgi:hypothetical protein